MMAKTVRLGLIGCGSLGRVHAGCVDKIGGAAFAAYGDLNQEAAHRALADFGGDYATTEVERISGKPGAFDVSLRWDGNLVPMQAGSVVMAVGWEPYDATGLEYLGLGKHANVINSVTLEELAMADTIDVLIPRGSATQTQHVPVVVELRALHLHGEWLPVQLGESRLRIKGIDLGWSAIHVEEDDVSRSWDEVRRGCSPGE